VSSKFEKVVIYVPTCPHLMVSSMHGFVNKKSCFTISTFEEWTFGIDVIFLDYSKAFDSLLHHRLICKLEGLCDHDITLVTIKLSFQLFPESCVEWSHVFVNINGTTRRWRLVKVFSTLTETQFQFMESTGYGIYIGVNCIISLLRFCLCVDAITNAYY